MAETVCSPPAGVNSGATGADDPDLIVLVAVWPTLAPALRTAVIEMIRAVVPIARS